MPTKILGVYIVAILCMIKTASSRGADYISARQEFKKSKVGLILDGSFAIKFNKLTKGIGYLVNEETWKDNESVIKCDFEKKTFCKMEGDGSDQKVDERLICRYIEKPVLFRFGKSTVLSVPIGRGKNTDEEACDSFLKSDMLKIVKQLAGGLPKRRIKMKLVIPGRDELELGMLQMGDVDTETELQGLIHKALEQEILFEWKKRHEEAKKRLPRKPPVVYGQSKKVIKRIDGTYEIPREEPTKRWTETVYADGFGTGMTTSGELVDVTVSIPVGERQREKKLHQVYDYQKLKAMLEDYQKKLEEFNNDKPPVLDEQDAERAAECGKVKFVL